MALVHCLAVLDINIPASVVLFVSQGHLNVNCQKIFLSTQAERTVSKISGQESQAQWVHVVHRIYLGPKTLNAIYLRGPFGKEIFHQNKIRKEMPAKAQAYVR